MIKFRPSPFSTKEVKEAIKWETPLVRSGHLRPSINGSRFNREDRTVCMSYYFFCHVADEQPLNTRPSMCGENDHIDALIFCRVENLFEGIAARAEISDLGQVLDPGVAKLLQQDL